MRPSAAQLLQHERLEFAFKVSETEKLYVLFFVPPSHHYLFAYSRLNTIKSHKATLTSKERDLLARESTLNETESRITDMIQQRDAQIQLLQSQLHECQSQLHNAHLQIHSHSEAIQTAVKQREYELRVLVLNQEEDVRRSMQKREEEIMEAIRRREAEVLEEWGNRERELRAFLGRELEVREQMFEDREEELRQREAAVGEEEERLASVRDLLEKTKNIDEKAAGMRVISNEWHGTDIWPQRQQERQIASGRSPEYPLASVTSSYPQSGISAEGIRKKSQSIPFTCALDTTPARHDLTSRIDVTTICNEGRCVDGNRRGACDADPRRDV